MSRGYAIAPARKTTSLVSYFDRGAYHAPAVVQDRVVPIRTNRSFPSWRNLVMKEPPRAKVEADGI